MAGDPRFKKALDDMWQMHVAKSSDYGQDEDPLANLRSAAGFNVPPWVGVMIRLQDKVHRLQSAAKGSTLRNEGVEDSLIDIASYAILALIIYTEEDEPHNHTSWSDVKKQRQGEVPESGLTGRTANSETGESPSVGSNPTLSAAGNAGWVGGYDPDNPGSIMRFDNGIS